MTTGISNISILAVDDRESIRQFIKDALESAGYRVDVASDGKDALERMAKKPYQLLITDLKMPRMDGMALLGAARRAYPKMPVIVLTAHGSIHNAVEAMKQGAADYLTKPLESPAALRRVVQTHVAEQSASHAAFLNTDDMVAVDRAMGPVITMLDKVAPTDATVLLTGQSGTGKEVAAVRIHRRSNRAGAPFIAVNCAAISSQLMESEMFGHEQGAFTGATEQKKGRFELAHRGTLFLDEVGELPLALQAKLLRVLQERVFERVGGNNPIEVDVRIVAATNRDLLQEIARGAFREDLYHRLSVFPVHLPSLQERPDDILPLAHFFLNRISAKQGRPLQLSSAAQQALRTHSWPGNIRELSNVLERAAILCGSSMIERDDLGFVPATATHIAHGMASSQGDTLKKLEKGAIQQALRETDGHRKNAAQRLGISLRSLYNKLKEYGIE